MHYVRIGGEPTSVTKKGKSKIGDDREVEMATALTTGNFASHNK